MRGTHSSSLLASTLELCRVQGGQWHLSEVERAWPEALTATPGAQALLFLVQSICYKWDPGLWISTPQAQSGRGPQKLFKSQFLGGGQVHQDMEDNTSVPGPFSDLHFPAMS